MELYLCTIRAVSPFLSLSLFLTSLYISSVQSRDETAGADSNNEQPKQYYEDNLSLTKPFQQEYAWDISGSAMITDKYIRLTPDQKSQQGSVWSKSTMKYPFWEVHIQFRVHGNGKSLFGDGFAMWYTQERSIAGPVFGSKNGFKGLGMFFDTYSNHQGEHNHAHPFVSGMVSNGSLLYDHDSDGTHTQLDGCHMSFRNSDSEAAVRIRYFKDVLTVHTKTADSNVYQDDEDQWIMCFEAEGVILPVNYHFGLSAVTGDLSDNHDIHSFKVFSIPYDMGSGLKTDIMMLRAIPQAKKFDSPRQHVEGKTTVLGSTFRSPLKTFLISVVVIIGAVFLIAVGYLFYKDREEKKMKRFY